MKRALGVCYYPEHWPEDLWPEDAARMVEAGLSWVRIGEFAWSRLEPEPGRFDWGWLDRAITVLGDAGLKVVLGTPSATPPRWMLARFPDMLAVDAQGRERRFGSRRHYCHSHAGYRQAAAEMAATLGRRYGRNPHVAAWQIDNEYGCHDTVLSYSDAARRAFRDWLAQRYQSPGALNRAWGNVFWSMEYSDFDEIDLPNLTVPQPNPAHEMAFRRFASDQVVAWNAAQVAALRPHTDAPLIHNYMGRVLEFDHFRLAADLDIASWDSYPIGFLSDRLEGDGAHKARYLQQGDPDMQAFHHDLYRAMNGGRWWVMEQQPGPVNWAPYNPAPLPGMVRLWSWEAFAHGAEVVSYFRWRQAPFAQEQFHTGLNRADGSPDVAFAEVARVAGEIADVPQPPSSPAPVGLVFDYPSLWSGEIQPQGADQDGFAIVLAWYRALRRLGQSIDILSPGALAAGAAADHAFVAAPFWPLVDEAAAAGLAASDAVVLIGARAGSRTGEHRIPEGLAPGPLRDLLGVRVERAESLRPGIAFAVGNRGSLVSWAEDVAPGEGVEVEWRRKDGRPALLSRGRAHYLPGQGDAALIESAMRTMLERAGLPIVETGEDLRIRDQGGLRFIFNYGPEPSNASHLMGGADRVLLGDTQLSVAGVAIVERNGVG